MTNTPSTPQHVEADQEVVLPTHTVPDSLSGDINLNEDLYDDDDSIKSQSEPAETNPSDSVSEYLFTLPFEDAYASLRRDYEKLNVGLISEAEQSRLVNHTDDALLSIQRKFIKCMVDVDQDLPPYTLDQLISDLDSVVRLLWYSVTAQNGVFGQDHYLIRILNDLEDYFGEYNLDDSVNMARLFVFLQSLDVRLSFAIDGIPLANGTTWKLSQTRIVRLESIVSRLRVLVVEKLDRVRRSKDVANVLDVEIGRLFEGILDRVGEI